MLVNIANQRFVPGIGIESIEKGEINKGNKNGRLFNINNNNF